MEPKRPVSVLVAPLDWGLGHATRCIPIINELNQRGTRVLIAASGSQKTLLKQEFPDMEFLDIPGYQISYKKGFLLKWFLLLNIPRLLWQIRKENKWLDELIARIPVDAVISDNRFGLYNEKLYTVFVTHQLSVQSGHPEAAERRGLRTVIRNVADRQLLKWNYRFINKFSCCWVPDFESDGSVAGKLSHPARLPAVPLKYTGILSRFEYRELPIQKNFLLILLSGPEPQRTLFENVLLKEIEKSDLDILLVRGLPGHPDLKSPQPKRFRIVNHLSAAELNEEILRAEYIVTRSGYSAIMDLIKLRRNAILVPTPGQTEQEYLGWWLDNKKWMYTVPQKKFRLEQTLNLYRGQLLEIPEIKEAGLKEAVDLLISQSKKS
jgi:UDP:flavonoid glycosyltransferase YjiC (YdhE family)